MPVEPRLVLWAETAEELMSPNPVSLRADATIHEAVAFLSDKGFSAAPVIDESGRPVGVLSRSDIVVHDRERMRQHAVPEYFSLTDLRTEWGERLSGFQVESVDPYRVADLMTQAVFSVRTDTPVHEVIEQMLMLKVHRLFVVDRGGTLVGVISALDVLRRLEPAVDVEPV